MTIRYSKYLPGFVFIFDFIWLLISFFIGNLLMLNYSPSLYNNSIFIVLASSIWLTVSALSKGYIITRPLLLRENVNRFILTLVYHLVILFFIVYILKLNAISRLFLFSSYAIFFVSIIFFRSVLFFFLDYIRKQGFNNRRVITLGDEIISKRLLDYFSDHPEYGFDVVDIISEDETATMTENEVFNRLSSNSPNEIFLCYKKIDGDWLNKLIDFSESNFIEIKVVSDLFPANKRVQLVNYHDLPVLHITSNIQTGLKVQMLKRTFDICFSIIIMIAGFPVFLILYLVTKTSSKGPAFYKQERIGKNGKPFYIYKFRSMQMDAEKLGPQLSKNNDPRITKWGKVIRQTRLDELPQFWNVLKGDMSVVGPRPERQHFIEKMIQTKPDYKKLLYIRPGITSIGQVDFGYAENVEEMCDRVQHDMKYLDNINLNGDLNIIIKTVKVMWQRKGK